MAHPTTAPVDWPQLLTSLMQGHNLSTTQAAAAMRTIMVGEASTVHIAAFLVALRAKGETVDELAGLAQAMLEVAQRIEVAGPTLDIVGTGGDRANTVNISTMASLVIAGAGVSVVKHGNRAASSTCGSADLLEELGIRLDLPADQVAACAAACGITFCFAPTFHPAMRYVAPTRRELGVLTAFNFLGPLTNPAQPQYAAIGVADARMAALMAGVFGQRGTRALVFRGDDGLDELTITTTSTVWVVGSAGVTEDQLNPEQFGIPLAPKGALAGGDRAHNAGVARALLAGEPGPVRDAVLLNAAAGLATLEPESASLAQRMQAGLERARSSLDSGAAAQVLRRWQAWQQR